MITEAEPAKGEQAQEIHGVVFTEAASSADAVHVRLPVHRDVQVDNQIHFLSVDSTRRLEKSDERRRQVTEYAKHILKQIQHIFGVTAHVVLLAVTIHHRAPTIFQPVHSIACKILHWHQEN